MGEISPVNKARELLMNDEIDTVDYKLMKRDCEEKINQLEEKLRKADNGAALKRTIIEKISNSFENLDRCYSKAETAQKRLIVSAIFPEKLEYENLQYRTPKLNEVASLILLVNKELGDNKNGTKADFSTLSQKVTWERLELSTH